MITSVPKFYRNIYYFEPRYYSAIQALFKSFLARRNIFLWNNTSFNSIDKFKPICPFGIFRQIFYLLFGKYGHWFNFNFNMAVISASAGLLDVFAFCFCIAGISFTISYLWFANI